MSATTRDTAPPQYTTDADRRAEWRQRAAERAQAEGLKAWKINEELYMVRSRFSAPGTWHQVRVAQHSIRRVVDCDCPAWTYRQACAHAATVERRLAREETRPEPATPIPWRDSRSSR